MASLEMVELGDHLSLASKNEINKYYGRSHFIFFSFAAGLMELWWGKKIQITSLTFA